MTFDLRATITVARVAIGIGAWSRPHIEGFIKHLKWAYRDGPTSRLHHETVDLLDKLSKK